MLYEAQKAAEYLELCTVKSAEDMYKFSSYRFVA
jgi:hypothetical protein